MRSATADLLRSSHWGHPPPPPPVFLPAVAVLAYFGIRGMGVSEGCPGASARKLHWMIHGVHHDHPNDPRRLVLPPAFAIPLGLLFFGLFVLVLGTPVAWAFAAGFYLGYVIYDTVHFALHHAKPRGWLGRRLRELHMRHHFEDHERGFGVSAPWWDIVFNTRPRQRRIVAREDAVSEVSSPASSM